MTEQKWLELMDTFAEYTSTMGGHFESQHLANAAAAEIRAAAAWMLENHPDRIARTEIVIDEQTNEFHFVMRQ